MPSLTASSLDHPGLRSGSRIWNGRAGFALAGDLAIAFTFGVLAALAVTYVEFPIRQMPGSALLKSVLPLAAGLALAPRRFSGLVESIGAATTIGMMRAFSMDTPGFGATTSLLALGPILDAMLWNARPGWRLYARFAAAGLLTNLLAFFVRGGTRLAQVGKGGGRTMQSWLPEAVWTYALFGLAAGLICAVILFRATPHSETGESGPAP